MVYEILRIGCIIKSGWYDKFYFSDWFLYNILIVWYIKFCVVDILFWKFDILFRLYVLFLFKKSFVEWIVFDLLIGYICYGKIGYVYILCV